MAKGETLGGFEQLTLMALVRLKDDAYGATIRRELAEKTGRDVNIGAVYATLDRLENKGLVTSFTGEPLAERGGRARRYFQLTPTGSAALQEAVRAMRGLLQGIQWGRI
jgi:PadR family transcriptional regulator, regulatory protein PadR